MSLPLEQIARDENLSLRTIGFREDQMRILLDVARTGSPSLVIELQGVISYWHKADVAAPISISNKEGHGSFGWWLPSEVKCNELRIAAKSEVSRTILIAIATSVVCRVVDEKLDLNFPG